MVMSNALAHILTGLIWGVYAITIGSLTVIYDFSSAWVFVSIIAAVVGNSAHLVAFAWSNKGLQISSSAGKT